MRCRSALAALAAMAALAAFASPEDTRTAIAARLRGELPELRVADYPLGSAAFDPELRARVEANAAAAAPIVEAGRKLWTRKFKDGRSLASCFPNGGRRIAGSYPQYDPRIKRIVTFELAVNQCLKTHHEPLYEPGDARTMGAILAYVRSLSNGVRMLVRVPPAAEPRFESGQRLYFARLGQLNFACASCHVQAAGRWYDDKAISPVIGQATHWPVIRDGAPVTIQMRIRECLEAMGAAPFALGSEELDELEYFVAYLSNGLPLKANAWRPQ